MLLWPMLERAGLLEGIDRNAELRCTFAAIASDDYEVAFSVGEIPPTLAPPPP